MYNKQVKESKYYNYERIEVAEFVPENIQNILDVGCGTGSFLKTIKLKTNANTWGIEIIESISDIAKKNVDFVLQGRIEDNLDNLPNDFFDCITFNDVLEHLYDPLLILNNIKPKLKENGVIIASIPNVRFFDNLFNLLIKRDWKYEDSGILDKDHIRFFTKKSATRMFEEADYEILTIHGINKKQTLKFNILNIFSVGVFSDTKYRQFIFSVKNKTK